MVDKKKFLVTGAAGFIGFHLANRLASDGHTVVGLDNINDYYDPNLKLARLKEAGIEATSNGRHGTSNKNSKVPGPDSGPPSMNSDSLKKHSSTIQGDLSSEAGDLGSVEFPWFEKIQSTRYPNYHFIRLDITEKERMMELFEAEQLTHVVHLAAQAGVRYSIENPDVYIQNNIVGFHNVLECCRHYPVQHLVYASSSSVYGNNKKVPFHEDDRVDHPISLYAATKKSNELEAYTYSHLYNIPTTGLRFFTVYGPWGRPDMALFIFTEKILKGERINVFNYGDMQRDFTYVDDIVEGVVGVMDQPPNSNLKTQNSDSELKTLSERIQQDKERGLLSADSNLQAPSTLYNIGRSKPVPLMYIIHTIEDATGKAAIIRKMPKQAGDMSITNASIKKIRQKTGYYPTSDIKKTIADFVEWYRTYQNNKINSI